MTPEELAKLGPAPWKATPSVPGCPGPNPATMADADGQTRLWSFSDQADAHVAFAALARNVEAYMMKYGICARPLRDERTRNVTGWGVDEIDDWVAFECEVGNRFYHPFAAIVAAGEWLDKRGVKHGRDG